MQNKDIKEEKVGYKNPPKSGQFKKGQSGNPAGRKKRIIPKSFYEAFIICANEIKTIRNENGVPQRFSMFEIFCKKIIQDACQKDGYSRKFLMDTFLKIDLETAYKALVEKSKPKTEETIDHVKLRNYLEEIYLEKLREEQAESEKNGDFS